MKGYHYYYCSACKQAQLYIYIYTCWCVSEDIHFGACVGHTGIYDIDGSLMMYKLMVICNLRVHVWMFLVCMCVCVCVCVCVCERE